MKVVPSSLRMKKGNRCILEEKELKEKINVIRLNRIVSILLYEIKDLSDEDRDLPIRWNIMHMYSSSQLAKLLALKRGIDIELAGIALALHDIGAVMTKKRKNHAEIAEPYVREVIDKYNSRITDGGTLTEIKEEEIEHIAKAIINHSNKEEHTDDPLVELVKDVDVLDRYLHGIKTEGAYLKRCTNVLKELGIEILQ